ncbi:signal peptidase I [Deinococcus detaillensis]|uniref:Signal peptidase I n=1 Tax=Deinococcus detaillensis TaxID=2592048 RepID=A0A553UU55_9DEIO|nr:signal peptidase I [Deinococcus detaillensis]TSA83757.1 signal peptidase I [Deinococcus detaillensis]
MIVKRDPSLTNWRAAWSWAEPLVFAVLLTQLVGTLVGVDGASMMPTLRHHERLLIPKYETWLHKLGIGDFKRGDILIFKPPTQSLNKSFFGPPFSGLGSYRPFLVKRLIGLPGDTVRVSGGEVYLNGALLSQRFTSAYWQSQGCWDTGSLLANAARVDEALGQVTPQITLKAGQYFVMGDNRTAGGSEDSRLFGPVPLRDIAGRAAAVVWPVMRQIDAKYDCAASYRPQDHVTYTGKTELNLRLLRPPAAFERLP